LMGQEANQMAESGFSPLAEISRTTGESMGDLMARMEAGGVTVAEVSNAFKTATSEGGRFKGLLETIAGTAIGQFNQFKEGIEAAVTPLGAALLPALTNILKKANEVLPAIAKLAKENASMFATVATAAVGVVAAGSAIVSLGIAAKVAAFGLSGIAGALGLLLNPITLVAGALGTAAYWFFTATEAGRTMASSLAKWFGQLRTIAEEAFGGIADALAAGDIQAAGRIAWLGLKATWLQGTKELREIWEAFKHVFLSTTIDITYGALAHWETFVANVKTLFAGLKGAAMETALDVGAWLNKIGKSDEEKAAIDRITAMAKVGFAGKQKADLAAIVAQKEQALKDLEASRKLVQGIQQGAFFGRMEKINADLAAAKADLAKAREDAAKARAAGGVAGINGAAAFNLANFLTRCGESGLQFRWTDAQWRASTILVDPGLNNPAESEDNSMIATSDRRPGRVGWRPSCDPGSGGARRQRGTRSPYSLRCRAYGLFASSSGCQSRLSLGALAPLGRFLFSTI
jgi:hypothetical protein